MIIINFTKNKKKKNIIKQQGIQEKKERKMKVIIQLDQLIMKKVPQILNIQKNKKLLIKEI